MSRERNEGLERYGASIVNFFRDGSDMVRDFLEDPGKNIEKALARLIESQPELVTRAIEKLVIDQRTVIKGEDNFPPVIDRLLNDGHAAFMGTHWSVLDGLSFLIAINELKSQLNDRIHGDTDPSSRENLLNLHDNLTLHVPFSSKFSSDDERMVLLGAFPRTWQTRGLEMYYVVQPGDDYYTTEKAEEINRKALERFKCNTKGTSQLIALYPGATRWRSVGAEEVPRLTRGYWAMNRNTVVIPMTVEGASEIMPPDRGVRGMLNKDFLIGKLKITYGPYITRKEGFQIAKQIGVDLKDVPTILSLAFIDDRERWGFYERPVGQLKYGKIAEYVGTEPEEISEVVARYALHGQEDEALRKYRQLVWRLGVPQEDMNMVVVKSLINNPKRWGKHAEAVEMFRSL